MIDVHCHLNFHAFEKDLDMVIRQAATDGVRTIINVGTQLDSSQKAVTLATEYPDLYAIVGIHPHHADKLAEGWIEELEQIATTKKVLAIGEIGLDYFSYQSNGVVDRKVQEQVFEQQIVLAHKLKLPLQIHNRHAGKETLEILVHHKNLLQDIPGMFHCFAGDIDFLKDVLRLGFYVGFDGNITYKGLAPGETTALRDLADYAPLDRILIETDSPFLTPIPHRGTRNVPSYAILVGEFLAQIKQVRFTEIDDITTKNAHTLFRLL